MEVMQAFKLTRLVIGIRCCCVDIAVGKIHSIAMA